MSDRVAAVWWLTLQPGEFYNIERSPQSTKGGGGARYIEIPTTLVADTYHFLGITWQRGEPMPEQTILAHTVGAPAVTGSITFKPKLRAEAGQERLRIANQNRQATPHLRHPAWRAERGFPQAPDSVASTADAKTYLPAGGVRLYLVRTTGGEYYAGFTAGAVPPELPDGHPSRQLYQRGRGALKEWSDA